MDCESESSLSPAQIQTYEVFLSFWSEDTGNKFTGHLFAALKRRGIFTFFPHNNREALSPPQILKAIDESQISIVVFSRNYAASTGCLEELAKIVQCRKLQGKIVCPVFYDVDPSDVRRQKGLCQLAFAEHEERFKHNLEKVERWRKSMTEAANISGWRVPDHKSETEVIDLIVKMAINILSHKSLSVDLVGMQSRVEEFEKLLDVGSDDVLVVGIWGMGGIGKTALASTVYYRNFHQFQRRCFLANLSDIVKTKGLMAARNQLVSAILDLNVSDIVRGSSYLERRLSHYRTLLVLDNVDDLEQLERLVGNVDRFGAGSKIIITTRDEHILKQNRVDKIYKVRLLNQGESLQLFYRTAFNCDYPLTDYEEISRTVLEYCEGLPLAIKSWGSFLFDRSVYEWKSALAKPLKVPDNSILNVLRQSFYGLDHTVQNIFLDIACFFVGEKIDYVKKILSYHEFCAEIGTIILMEKSLMTISNQRIQMHYMLKEMGREIVWQESLKEPGERSRIWLYDDFRHVMHTNSATAKVKAIVLNQDDLEGTPLNAKAFREMIDLRLLIIQNVNFTGSLEYLSNELSYLLWHKYPFTCLPSGFEPHNLVELIMPESSITLLWEGLKRLPKLRIMNLRGSKNLIKTPDFSGILNLETLDLQGCIGLLQLHPSIAVLPKLTFLNLKNCTSLVSIPNNLLGISSLETLNLDGCSIQVKILSNQHCPFFAKMLCYHFISFLKGIKNNKLVFGCLVCLIYSIFSACNYRRSEVS